MAYGLQEASKAQKVMDGSLHSPHDLLPYLRLGDGRTVRGSIPCIEFLEEGELEEFINSQY
jgi:hypothetical protein